MTKLLLDANLSPKTARLLTETFDLDVTALLNTSQGGLPDEDVVELARNEGRVVITLDLDFGELYFQRAPLGIGVIILRLADQSRLSVEAALIRFFRNEAEKIDLAHSLVIIEDSRIRILRLP